ncbi:hypothetical protein KL86CLO1_12588 [uncultured Eubacteriales bacterium]|uniref:Uncharacterized protein n=1 Tax=uncultured Eubacteriales bacterium TaxID=172733 RepID=A0A212KBT8_9FIRM|nr:hypothetical protein KL86CLO1_12588 [uncultured Eubacteriales bacterium]
MRMKILAEAIFYALIPFWFFTRSGVPEGGGESFKFYFLPADEHMSEEMCTVAFICHYHRKQRILRHL